MPPNHSEVVAFDPIHLPILHISRSWHQYPGGRSSGHWRLRPTSTCGSSPRTARMERDRSTSSIRPLSVVAAAAETNSISRFPHPSSVCRGRAPGHNGPSRLPPIGRPRHSGSPISIRIRSTERPIQGSTEIDISDSAHPIFIKRYLYPTVNLSSFFGAKPWDIVAPPNSNYVYAADNGDAEIVRINKATGQLQEFPIPLTTDVENAFGLAISSGRLYFTLADDYDAKQLPFGAASTFGYINLSSWPE